MKNEGPNIGAADRKIEERTDASEASMRREKAARRKKRALAKPRGGIQVPPGMTEVINGEQFG